MGGGVPKQGAEAANSEVGARVGGVTGGGVPNQSAGVTGGGVPNQSASAASWEAECQIGARRRTLPNGNSNKKGTVIDAHVPEPAMVAERSLKHAHGVVPGRLHRFSPVGLRRRRRSRWRSARAERGCRCRRWRPSREGVAVQTVVASREGMEGTEEAHGPVGSIVGGLNRAVLTKPCLFS
jgi:hypothetical protein